MFPPEIWKECFGDSPKENIKILSTLSKDLSSTFQPLLFEELQFVWEGNDSKIYSPAKRSIEESVIIHFTKRLTFSGGFKDVSWEDYFARIIRGGDRFKLISTDPRLAAFVRKCRIEGPRSTFPTSLPPPAESLASVIQAHYQSALDKMLISLSNFRNLRELIIQSLDITSQVLRHIEQIPNLTDLTFNWCLFDGHPGAFNPPCLNKLKFLIYETIILPEANPKPEWASQVAAILPAQTLIELTLDIKDSFHYQELQMFAPLQKVGRLSCMQTLSIPIPQNVKDAGALISVLENSPNLLCLKLQDPDLDHPLDRECNIPYHQLPDVSRAASPLLNHLVAPIEWARVLVPGRPIRILKVYRMLIYETEPDASFYEMYDPFRLLHVLSKTSSRVEELSLPFLGDDEKFHILEVIAGLFPFVRILSLVLPDAGLDHIPEPTPSPPPSPCPTTAEVALPNTSVGFQPLVTPALPDDFVFRRPPPFVPPPLQEIHEALVQVNLAVSADLASAPVGAYKAAVAIQEDIYCEVWDAVNEWASSRTTEDVAYPNTTYPVSVRHDHWCCSHGLNVLVIMNLNQNVAFSGCHIPRSPTPGRMAPPSIHHQASSTARAGSRG